MSDTLNRDLLNSLPQPLFVRLCAECWWHVYDIDVQTGLFRIDVCGILEIHHYYEALGFKDDSGKIHDPDDFCLPPPEVAE